MPNVNPAARTSSKNSGQVTRNGQHTREDIDKIQRDAKARDNLKAAFAGEENKGPASDQKRSTGKSTQVKSRNTKSSKSKTPVK